MGIIFLSHSSKNNDLAVEVRDWLRDSGWRETFLDLDPEHGLAPGQRWQEELKKAGERCSAVVVLVSPDWLKSDWCRTEFLLATQLGKLVFPVIVAPTPIDVLPREMTAHFQLADISTPERRQEGYERLYYGLRRAGLHPKDFDWPPKQEPDRLPYRGLRTLEEEDAAVFFGRDAAITKGLDALRRMRDGAPERILVVLGASGAGKSSFLRAGLIPRLRRDVENFLVLPIVRPERAVLTGPNGLLRALGIDSPSEPSDAILAVRRVRDSVSEDLSRRAKAGRYDPPQKVPTAILAIDQAEELFAADNTEASAALDLLMGVLKEDQGLLVVLTMRSDSLPELQAEPRVNETIAPRMLFDLPRVSIGAIKEIIEGPGELAKPPIKFDPSLVDILVADLSSTDALPLLAMTLAELAGSFKGDGPINIDHYRDGIGGIDGSMRRAIDNFYADVKRAEGRSRDEVARLTRSLLVPGLVRIDHADAEPKRRMAAISEIPETSRVLVEFLADHRLVVTDTRNGEPVVEVAHEAVLRNWSELKGWIEAERDVLTKVESVVRAASDWSAKRKRVAALEESLERDRSKPDTGAERQRRRTDWDSRRLLEQSEKDLDQLLNYQNELLASALGLLRRPELHARLGESVAEFLDACQKKELQENRRERLIARLLTGADWTFRGLLLLAAVGGSIWAFNASRDSSIATSTRIAADAERAALNQETDRSLRLAMLSLKSEFLRPASANADVTIQRLLAPSNPSHVFKGSSSPSSHISFAADGLGLIATDGAGEAMLWCLVADRWTQRAIGKPGSIATAAVFVGNGRTVAIADQMGEISIWTTLSRDDQPCSLAAAWTSTAILSDQISKVQRMAASRDGALLAAGDFAGRVRVWSRVPGTSDEWREEILGSVHQATILDLDIAPDQSAIASTARDGRLVLWKKGPPAPDVAWSSQVLERRTRAIISASFSGDGGTLVSASEDGNIKRWSRSSKDRGTPWYPVDIANVPNILSVELSPKATRLVSVASTGATTVWARADGDVWVSINTFDASKPKAALAISNRADKIAIAYEDGTVAVWDTSLFLDKTERGAVSFLAPSLEEAACDRLNFLQAQRDIRNGDSADGRVSLSTVTDGDVIEYPVITRFKGVDVCESWK